MREPTYSRRTSTGTLRRRTIAPGVLEQHSRGCAGTRSGRGCTCRPTYRARVKSNGQQHERTFPTLAEAVAWRESAVDAFRRGQPIALAPAPPAPRFEDVAISFIQRAASGEALTRSRERFSRSTLEGYEIELRLRVLPCVEPRSGLALADIPVTELGARAIQATVDSIALKSPASARKAAAAIASVLRFAYQVGFRDELPPQVLLPPPPPRRKQVLDGKQRRRLREVARADDTSRKRSLLAPLVALLDDTGMRVSEALGLVWGPEGLDLDATPPVVRVSRDSTKTDAGVRTIRLSRETINTLRKHRLACGRPDVGRPVFADSRGRPLHRSGRVRCGLARLSETTGIEFSPHVFRHTHATELAASGVPPASAALRLGHADGGVTFLRTYVHASEPEAAAAFELVAAYRKAATRR